MPLWFPGNWEVLVLLNWVLVDVEVVLETHCRPGIEEIGANYFGRLLRVQILAQIRKQYLGL